MSTSQKFINFLSQFLDNNQKLKLKNFSFSSITTNSKFVKKDTLFIAIKGCNFDGHNFVPEVIKKGGFALIENNYEFCEEISDRIIKLKKGIKTTDIYFDLFNYFYNLQLNNLKLIGITGTNGKTTITFLIKSILDTVKMSNFIIGTIGCIYKNKKIELNNTTPGVEDIFNLLFKKIKIQKNNFKYCIMEVSSHSLDQKRVNPDIFKYTIFTNLTQDHLDYHKTMKNYFNAKLKLFSSKDKNKIAIINIDDFYGKKIYKKCKYKKIITYGLKNKNADITAVNISYSIKNTLFDILYKGKKIAHIKTNLIGEHNIYNILSAFAFGLFEKIKINLIVKGIERLKLVKGRLEKYIIKNRIFFIDYAHTPDALLNVLKILNRLKINNIITVFGCGGDRDKSKRPLMGSISVQYSDFVFITSDNPRTENPISIINDIVSGIDKEKYKNFFIEVDREKAIKSAFAFSKENDIILIAGKGHETYQIIGTQKKFFSDQKIVLSLRENN